MPSGLRKEHDVAVPRRAAHRTGDGARGTAYAADVSAWALEQAGHLRAGRWAEIDVAHLAEEIEALSRAERHALTSALRLILLHMLKWDRQRERRSRSWTVTIRTQRLAVAECLEDSPSLLPERALLMARAYRRARIEAASETGLPERDFPHDCPYGFDEVMERGFPWPDASEES